MSRVLLAVGITLHALSVLVALAVLLPLALVLVVVVLPIQFLRASWHEAERVIYGEAR